MRPPALKNCGAGQQFTLFAQDHRFDKGHCNDIKGEFGQILHTDTVVLPWLLQKFKNSIVTFYPHTKKSETQKKRNEKPYIHAQKKNHPSLLQQKISPTIPPPDPHGEKNLHLEKLQGFSWHWWPSGSSHDMKENPNTALLFSGNPSKITIYLHWFPKKRGNSMTLHKLKHQEMLSIILEFHHLEFPDSIVSSFLAFSMCSCATTHAPRSC